jgi:hypothetical protein
MHPLLFFLSFFQAEPAGEPLRSHCALDAESIATVAPSDRVQVISALAGDGKPCYKIVVSRPGQSLTGYVLGDALPAIRQFERQREMASQAASEAQARLAQARAAATQQKEIDADKPKDPLISKEFGNFSGVDSKGKLVSLAGLKGRVTLVTFWSPDSRQAPTQVMAVMPLYNQFHNQGLAAVSVSMNPNPDRILAALDDVSPSWPQLPDRSGLAAQYNVDPKAGKVFVLDSEHRIVAAGPMGPDIEKAVKQLMTTQ